MFYAKHGKHSLQLEEEYKAIQFYFYRGGKKYNEDSQFQSPVGNITVLCLDCDVSVTYNNSKVPKWVKDYIAQYRGLSR
jgi:hypothetical protein